MKQALEVGSNVRFTSSTMLVGGLQELEQVRTNSRQLETHRDQLEAFASPDERVLKLARAEKLVPKKSSL